MRYEVTVKNYENTLCVCAQFMDIRDAFDFFKGQYGKEVNLTNAETGELYIQRFGGDIVWNVFAL